jgi:hypothetical protein
MPRSVYKTQSKWCINKHGASKIIDTFETYHPTTGRVAQKSVIHQQSRDAKKLETRLAEEERAEQAKKAKFDSLVTLEGLSAPEFLEMRSATFMCSLAILETDAFIGRNKS